MTVLFLGFLLTIVVLSGWAIFSIVHEEKSQSKLITEQKAQIKKLDTELNERNLEVEKSKKQILELKNQLLQTQDTSKKESLNRLTLEKKSEELQAQLAKLENELNKKVKEAETFLSQLAQSQDALKKENSDRLSLEKKLQETQAQLTKSDKELASQMQMFAGLKGQYDELERDIEKLQQELANKDSALKTEQS